MPNKNNGIRSTSSKNNDSKPVLGRNNGDNEVNGFGIDRNSVKYAEKSRK